MTEAEILSDHRYIRFEVSARAVAAPPAHTDGAPLPSQWALKCLDRDALVAAVVVIDRNDRVRDGERDGLVSQGDVTDM